MHFSVNLQEFWLEHLFRIWLERGENEICVRNGRMRTFIFEDVRDLGFITATSSLQVLQIPKTPLTWKNSFLMDTIKVIWFRFSKLILWYSFFKIGRIEENGLKNLDNGIKWCLNTLVLLLWIIYQFDWVLSSSDNRSKKGTEYILPIPFSFPLRAGTGNRPAISEHREIRQIIWFIIYDSEYCRHSWQEKSFLNGTNNQEK